MSQNFKSQALGKEPVLKLLIRLSIPGIVAMAIQALYNIVDSIFIGRLSTEGLAALSLAFPVQMVLIGIAVGTGIGTGSLIARLLGNNQRKKAQQVAEHVMIIICFYGLVIGVGGFWFAESILHLFSNEVELIALGSDYIRIILIGSISLFLPMISNNILRAQGNNFLPMIALLIGSILNIILDPFLIFGWWFFPRLEIMGAALATVISKSLSCIFIMIILYSKQNEIKPLFKKFRFDWGIIKSIYQVGLPAMFMQFLSSLMLIGINSILGSFTPTALAVFGVFFRLQTFIFLPIFGLNQGYLPIMAYNFGQKNFKRMQQAFKSVTIMSLFFSLSGFFIFQFFPQNLIAIFNQDPQLIALGTACLKNVSWGFPIVGPAIICEVTFQALGRGMPSLILSFLRQIIILLPLAYLLGTYYSLNALWFAFPLSEMINGLIAVFWLATFLKSVYEKSPQLYQRSEY